MQDEGCTTYGSGNAASYFYKFVIHFTDHFSFNIHYQILIK